MSEQDALGKVLPLPPAPDTIELRHLRAFVAVAEELNFGRAATRLYISSPALSRQISALERLVGCQLLRRSTHRVELTLAGEALLACARGLIADLAAGVAATRAVGGELTSQANRFWEPVAQLATTDASIEDIRAAYEGLHAQFAPPSDVGVRPVNADGVPSLLIAPEVAPVTDRAGLLYLHGGAHSMGSAFGYRPLTGALAVAADVVVLVPEYRLAPEHPFPAALDDAQRAYLWLLDQGVRPDQITVAGDSSGASLAMSLLLRLRQLDLPQPGGAVLLCPALDLQRSYGPSAQRNVLPEILPAGQIRDFVAGYLAGHPVDDPVLNPLTVDLTDLAPLLIQAATGDRFVDEAHALADHAREYGVEATLELYPADTHVFHIFWSFLPEAADAVNQIGRFVRRVRAGLPASGDQPADLRGSDTATTSVSSGS